MQDVVKSVQQEKGKAKQEGCKKLEMPPERSSVREEEVLPKGNCFLLASPLLLRKDVSMQPLQQLEIGSLG